VRKSIWGVAIRDMKYINRGLHSIGICVAVWCVFLFAFSSFCQASTQPIDQLRVTMDEILAILKTDDSLYGGWPQKKEKVVRVITRRFDSTTLARSVLAKYWKQLTADEKEHFIHLFSQVLEHTYINKIKSYSDEEVVFLKQKVYGKKAVVYSQIIRDQMEIPITYKVKKDKDEWFIYDIIIEGVSLVKNYRQQFKQILMNESYPELVRRMDEKIRENKMKDREEKE
jgi:phospholipid transport system substrate-binding protein